MNNPANMPHLNPDFIYEGGVPNLEEDDSPEVNNRAPKQIQTNVAFLSQTMSQLLRILESLIGLPIGSILIYQEGTAYNEDVYVLDSGKIYKSLIYPFHIFLLIPQILILHSSHTVGQ